MFYPSLNICQRFEPSHQRNINRILIQKQSREQNKQPVIQQIAIMFLIIVVVVVSSILLIYAIKADPQLNNQKQREQKMLYLQLPQGLKFKLNYLSPQIIRPQKVPQNFTKLLHLPDSEQFRLYLKNLPQSDIQFKSMLYLSWIKQKDAQTHQDYMFQSQFYRYSKKYDMQTSVDQKSLCILSPYRNLHSGEQQSWKIFLKSINQQNYSNYNLFMIDDFSDDDSIDAILLQVKRYYPRLNNRLTIVKNLQNIGALGNRDFVTRNLCKSGDIVIDVDGDDALIGKQVFNLINRIYFFYPKAWFVYTNHLSVVGQQQNGGEGRNIDITQSMEEGICRRIQSSILLGNKYRTDQSWVTSQLRTYLRDLYFKIPLSHVLEPGSRKYYIRASDRFSMYALVELSGYEHTYFIEQYAYFYYKPNFMIVQKKGCKLPLIIFNQAKARILPPLLPLQSLDGQVQITKEYQLTTATASFYESSMQAYQKCVYNDKISQQQSNNRQK